MNYVVIYSIIVAYGNLNPVFPEDSYLRLANHIVADFEKNKPDIQSIRKYLEYVKSRLSGEEQMRSLCEFKRHFYAWARRRDLV